MDETERNLIEAGAAPATRAAHEADRKFFWRWAKLALKVKEQYPVPDGTVLKFIEHCIFGMPQGVDKGLVKEGLKRHLGTLSPQTVERRLASISYHHKIRDIEPNPVRSGRVRLAMRRAKAAWSRQGGEPLPKAAILRPLLERMLSTFNGKNLTDRRDIALLYFAFSSGGRRRSEVASARFKDLEPQRGGFVFHLRRSKTDQSGHGLELALQGKAKDAMRVWLAASGIKDGFLFRSIRHGRLTKYGISPETLGQIVKQRVGMLGLDPRLYSAHSIRHGYITQALLDGVPLPVIMQATGHRSVQTLMKYYRQASLWNSKAARLMD